MQWNLPSPMLSRLRLFLSHPGGSHSRLHCNVPKLSTPPCAHQQELWHPLLGLPEKMLEVQQDGLLTLPRVHKGGGNTSLATAASTANPATGKQQQKAR